MIYFDNNKQAYAHEIPDYICKIEESEWEMYAGTDKWDIVNGVFTDITDTPEYIAKKERQEREHVNNLTMTPLDFIKVLQSFGLTLQKINEFLESNLDIKMQLTYCSNVYCGVVKSFLPMTIEGITITPEMAELAFKAKNGEVIND
jgi:hypothetical protein